MGARIGTSFSQLFMGAVSPCFSFSSDAEFSMLFSTVSFLHDVQFSIDVSGGVVVSFILMGASVLIYVRQPGFHCWLT